MSDIVWREEVFLDSSFRLNLGDWEVDELLQRIYKIAKIWEGEDPLSCGMNRRMHSYMSTFWGISAACLSESRLSYHLSHVDWDSEISLPCCGPLGDL